MIRLIVHLARRMVSVSCWDSVEKTLRTIIFLLMNILLFITLCCWLPLGWNLIDSFYFCIITLATIVYGGVAPVLTLTKILIAILTLLGTIILVLLAGKLGEVVLDRRYMGD